LESSVRMGATFRKMTGRMNKAERRAWRKVLAEKEWLEDIERYRIELEEEKRIEQERLAMEKMKLQEMEERRRKKALEEKLKKEREEEEQRILRKEIEEKQRIEMEKLRIKKRLEEKLQNEEKVKEELRTLIKAEAASKEFINVLIKQGASKEELSIQKKFLESYYMNKRNNLVDCVESIERYDELKMEVIEEAQKHDIVSNQPETNEKSVEIKVERRKHHHYHRDGSVSIKPTPKKRRHHRRKIRVTDEINDIISSPQGISTDSINCYYIGGKIGAITYHKMLDEQGQTLSDDG